jgi:hypothetical protein
VLLPLVSLALWATLIAVPLTLSYVGHRATSKNASSRPASEELKYLSDGKISQITVTVDDSLIYRATRFSHAIQNINLPALTVDLLIDRFSSSWPDSWTPFGLYFETWRAIIYPIYCLPFWWFAGLGIDAVRGRRHLRWSVLLLGTLLCGFFLFIACGLIFGLPAEDHRDMGWVFYRFGLWVTLLATFPTAWVRRGIASRHNRLSQTSSAEAV